MLINSDNLFLKFFVIVLVEPHKEKEMVIDKDKYIVNKHSNSK